MQTRRAGVSARLAAAIGAIVIVAAVAAYSYSATMPPQTTTYTSTATVQSTSAETENHTETTSFFNTTIASTSVIAVTVNGTQTTVTASASGLNQFCNTQVETNSTGPADAHAPVLLMGPNSTALVCVTYQSWWQGNQTKYDQSEPNFAPYYINGTYRFIPFPIANYSYCGSSGLSCIQRISHSFRVTSYPDYVQVSGSLDYVTILYTVTSFANSTGLYGTSAPWMECASMPMAVGYSAAQLNASDFPQPDILCPVEPFSAVSVSVLGMGVTYIDLLARS